MLADGEKRGKIKRGFCHARVEQPLSSHSNRVSSLHRRRTRSHRRHESRLPAASSRTTLALKSAECADDKIVRASQAEMFLPSSSF